MAPEPLHTHRLRLDPFTPADAPLLAALSATPEVMHFIGDGTPWPPTRAAEVSERTAGHWREHGFGWWVATLSATGTAIGFAALNFAGADSGIATDDHEIGWWLAPTAWGRGLAREGAIAVRDDAFTRLGAPRVVARIAPVNVASLRVAEAIGLTRDADSTGRAGEPIAVLSLSAAGWRTGDRQDARA
ncbi:MAG: GNAT family N-acetyltransferase [Actinomycetota bacterium]|nr:GNAT family N-acetyltransferase [Actinomycetota bacterium]